MRSLCWVSLAAVTAVVSCSPRTPAAPASGMEVNLKGRSLSVKVLATEKDRRHALEDLGPVAPGSAVLLAWPRERYLKLESENARASFDAVFLDRSGKVVDLQPLKQEDREGIQSRAEAAFALLLGSGQAAALGVRSGETAQLPSIPAQELPALKIGGATAFVELALTAAEREQGLMFRPRMSADDGMLFAYEDEGVRKFWMGNTLIPLDIAFFKDDGTLLNVNETPTYPDPRHPPANYATSDSDGPARFVLEMNRGWFKRKGLVEPSGRVKPGIKVAIPREARAGAFD